MKNIVITVAACALLTGAAAVVFVYSGIYDVSASTPHSGLVKWTFSTTMHASVARRAEDIVVPDLSDEAFALAGINDFEAMCVDCHGAPGKSPSGMGKGLSPPAPDLQKVALQRTPAEMFWAVKHGIKMTGMPAWGVSHDDDTLWPVVAFITILPRLDAGTYAEMLVTAKGKGHHTDDAPAHMPGNRPAGEEAHHYNASDDSAGAPETRQDHSSHDHKH